MNLITNGHEARPRERLAALGASLFARGLTTGTSGNLSVRVSDGWLMTPTNASLGTLDPDRLSKLDENGRHVGGDRPTKESLLHLVVGYPLARSATKRSHNSTVVAEPTASWATSRPRGAWPVTEPDNRFREDSNE